MQQENAERLWVKPRMRSRRKTGEGQTGKRTTLRTQESLLCSQEPRAHDSFEEPSSTGRVAWRCQPCRGTPGPSSTNSSLPGRCPSANACQSGASNWASERRSLATRAHPKWRPGWLCSKVFTMAVATVGAGLHHPTGAMCRGPCPRNVPEAEG